MIYNKKIQTRFYNEDVLKNSTDEKSKVDGIYILYYIFILIKQLKKYKKTQRKRLRSIKFLIQNGI